MCVSKAVFRNTVLAGVAAALAAPAATQEAGPLADDVVIVHGILPEQIETVPGSVLAFDAEMLERMRPITIKDVLRRAPGVQVIDEDAFGLKLNVSVRGLNPRRSGRTLLLEDGAPIQPAPYADPSAHYYTPLERIERVEFRKGSGQVLYGPQSVGGMINFVTRPTPEGPEAEVTLTGGERNYFGAHVAAGIGGEDGGVRLDLLHKHGDGIRDGHDTQVNEAAIKGRLEIDGTQALTLKAAYYTEDTSLSEGGLTQARFDITPYYNPFHSDRFDLQRLSLQAIHDWRINDGATLSTQVYYADTSRASYRQADTSIDPMTANPATGCIGAARIDYENFSALCGNKMRPRTFAFWGVEPRLDLDYALWGVASEAVIGLRAHFEDTNRKRYNGLTPDAREDSPGTLLRDDNQIATDAYSAYAQNAFLLGDLTITPGVRIERVETLNTARVANFIAIDQSATDTETTVLPGFGITWSGSPKLTVFAGVHRGFAPPRPDRDYNPNAPFHAVRPEKSIETEVGVRTQPWPGVYLDATVFDMQLEDLIVEGPLVGGRSGTFVNAGEALHQGFEAFGRVELGAFHLIAAYTNLFTAEFQSNVDETSSGVKGNRIPYAPEHLFNAAIGYESPSGLGVELGVDYVSEQFANASNNAVASPDGLTGLIPSRTLYRVALNFRPQNAPYKLFLSAENVTDEAYISSRVDGLFAGPGRQIVAGIEARY